jgi:hypothetical protein
VSNNIVTDGSSPGISAEFLNSLETFLASNLSSAAYDTTITSNGTGGVTLAKVTYTTGSIFRIAKFTGSGTATITHNWGAQADIVLAYYNGAFGTAPTQAIAITGETSNAFQVVAQSGYSWSVLAIKF